MNKSFTKYVVGGALLATVFIDNAYAIPSFARQTGFECTVCHTVFPELTQTGREFKLRGYTLSKGEKRTMFSSLSAMVMADVTNNTNNDNGNDVIAKNGAITIPQISLFFGGKITDKSGAFIQVTDSPSRYLPESKDLGNGNVHLDNMDIRYADSFTLADKELIYGVSVNNNPSMSDLWNSTPAWTFPYAQTGMSHAPTTGGAQVDGSLGQAVGGVGAYAMWNDLLYAELSVYRSAKPGGIMGLFGWKNQGLKGDIVNDISLVQGTAPYARVALQQNFGDNYVMVGGYMMNTKINPAVYGNAGGPLDQYKDHAIDAEYQYTNGSHIVTATATKIWEKQTLDGSVLVSGSNPSNTLSTTRARVSYYFDQKYGASVGIFSTTGSSDAGLYNTNTNFSPNSSGKGAELDYLPLQNIKLALQYTSYDTFNGASTYVGTTDGLMHKASENNNFYLLAWFMF
ncbi:hypothetical protein [Sulfuricurvum sp.]|uniref:hypothetical protein n=1 Tax=Sulfuricurvum sp. TaxID=2025608 RepID=UPI0035641D98